MWKKAKEDCALTPLGAMLGHDIEKLMKANALLGYVKMLYNEKETDFKKGCDRA
jgi:hypothetical protein